MIFGQRQFEWVTEPIASIAKAVQVNDPERGRYYLTPEGKELISVTRFLGEALDKSHIEKWKKRVGEAEAARILLEAGIRGTTFHAVIESYLQNLPGWKQKSLEAPLFKNIKTVIDLCLGRIYGQEFALYSDYLNLAGTCDLCAEWNGKLSIVDWKSSLREKKKEWLEGYFFQTCIYSLLLQERTGLKAEKLVIVMGVDGQMKPSVFVENRADWIPKVLAAVKKMGLLSIPNRGIPIDNRSANHPL